MTDIVFSRCTVMLSDLHPGMYVKCLVSDVPIKIYTIGSIHSITSNKNHLMTVTVVRDDGMTEDVVPLEIFVRIHKYEFGDVVWQVDKVFDVFSGPYVILEKIKTFSTSKNAISVCHYLYKVAPIFSSIDRPSIEIMEENLLSNPDLLSKLNSYHVNDT